MTEVKTSTLNSMANVLAQWLESDPVDPGPLAVDEMIERLLSLNPSDRKEMERQLASVIAAHLDRRCEIPNPETGQIDTLAISARDSAALKICKACDWLGDDKRAAEAFGARWQDHQSMLYLMNRMDSGEGLMLGGTAAAPVETSIATQARTSQNANLRPLMTLLLIATVGLAVVLFVVSRYLS